MKFGALAGRTGSRILRSPGGPRKPRECVAPGAFLKAGKFQEVRLRARPSGPHPDSAGRLRSWRTHDTSNKDVSDLPHRFHQIRRLWRRRIRLRTSPYVGGLPCGARPSFDTATLAAVGSMMARTCSGNRRQREMCLRDIHRWIGDISPSGVVPYVDRVNSCSGRTS